MRWGIGWKLASRSEYPERLIALVFEKKVTMNRYCLLPLVLVLFAISATSASAQTAKHTKDSTKTIKEKMKKKTAVLIDVREEREWKTGHLEQATLVPLSKLKTPTGLKAMLKKLPKDKKTVVYCH